MDQETLSALRKALKGKRARFCEEYVIDGNGTDAVIRAGITENRASAAALASRYLLEPAVRAYRDGLIEAAAEAVNVNRDSLIVKSERIYQKCMEKDDAKGAVKAAELQAKLTGNLTEKREVDTGNGFEIIVQRKGERDADPS